jgi:hypothetical protein
MKEMSMPKVSQITKKQLEIAKYLVEGYSHRDIERRGVASRGYIDKLKKNPEFVQYLHSLMEEWQKYTKTEMLLIAKQKVRELIDKPPKKDLLDYLDFITKLTGNYAPTKQQIKYNKYEGLSEEEIDKRLEELLADLGRVQENAGIIDPKGLRQPN